MRVPYSSYLPSPISSAHFTSIRGPRVTTAKARAYESRFSSKGSYVELAVISRLWPQPERRKHAMSRKLEEPEWIGDLLCIGIKRARDLASVGRPRDPPAASGTTFLE